MGFLERIAIWIVLIFFFVLMIGYTSQQNKKEELQRHLRMVRNNDYIPDLGVDPPRKPTRVIRFNAQEKECLTKDEFYEGMEDAEMRGMGDDPSAQDIYDEFNR